MKLLKCGRKLCRLFNLPSFLPDIAFYIQTKKWEEKKLLFEAINIRNNLVASCFMLLKKNLSASYINILQIKFLK